MKVVMLLLTLIFAKLKRKKEIAKVYKEVKVIEHKCSEKGKVKVTSYKVIIMKLICMMLIVTLFMLRIMFVEQVNDYEVFVWSRESS